MTKGKTRKDERKKEGEKQQMKPIEHKNKRWGVGIVGARGWGGTAHIPALQALEEEYEVRAVTGTRMESAQEAARSFGIRSFFTDAAEMASQPDIDIVVVTVRVPEHKRIIRAALNAGKHVFSEWPLARNTEEAEELAAMADKHNIVHMVGLQARANPTIRRLKDMIQDGVIGRVLAVNAVVSLPAFPTANGTVDLAHAYLLDQANGADQLTIGAAHILDPIEYMVAPLSEVSAKLDTQFADVSVLENGQTIQADAPDHVLIAGTLTQGAHVSIQVVNGGASGFTMRLIGSDGEIAITPQDGLMFQMDRLRVHIDRASGETVAIPTPEAGVSGKNTLPGEGYNVAHLYQMLAQQLEGINTEIPDFHHAVRLHTLLDSIRHAAATGTRQRIEAVR